MSNETPKQAEPKQPAPAPTTTTPPTREPRSAYQVWMEESRIEKVE